jgi:hypothetical protein
MNILTHYIWYLSQVSSSLTTVRKFEARSLSNKFGMYRISTSFISYSTEVNAINSDMYNYKYMHLDSTAWVLVETPFNLRSHVSVSDWRQMIYLEGQRQTTKNFTQDSRLPDRDLNQRHPTYKARMLPAGPQCWALSLQTSLCYNCYVKSMCEVWSIILCPTSDRWLKRRDLI